MAKAKASKMSARRSTSVQRKRRPGTTKTAKRAAPARQGRRAVTPAARAATTARTTPGTATSAKTSAPAGSYRAKVRMYRQGLGDCFLVLLKRADGSDYKILIDCGVVLGTPDPATIMTQVVDDIR